jgi:hypothetical protein
LASRLGEEDQDEAATHLRSGHSRKLIV